MLLKTLYQSGYLNVFLELRRSVKLSIITCRLRTPNQLLKHGTWRKSCSMMVYWIAHNKFNMLSTELNNSNNTSNRDQMHNSTLRRCDARTNKKSAIQVIKNIRTGLMDNIQSPESMQPKYYKTKGSLQQRTTSWKQIAYKLIL